MSALRIPGLPGGGARFDVVAEAYYVYHGPRPRIEQRSMEDSMRYLAGQKDVFEQALEAAERGCVLLGVGGSDRREAVRRVAKAAGIVGMWGATDHAGIMAREAGIPFLYGAVYGIRQEGTMARDWQVEFHRRAAAMHGRRVRLYAVGAKAFCEAVA